jgi:cytochrome c peroxidase
MLPTGGSMLKTLAILFMLTAALAGSNVVLQPPLGLDLYMPVPEANPLTRAKVELGRKLFFDKRLSRDYTLACASCHDPRLAFTDGRPIAVGINKSEGTGNSPALINRGYGSAFFWDGRAGSLERQAIEPILNPRELGMTESELERTLGMKSAEITGALASFVRTIRSGNSNFDRYAAGKQNALTATEKAGLAVFRGKGGCSNCHVGPNFTDERFHNTGVAWRDNRVVDEGRFTNSNQERDRGAFKTPTLREIARTAPYMHDGSLATLEEVVEFYSSGGRQNPYTDRELRAPNFTAEEKRVLLAFLRSLTGDLREGWKN